MPFPRYLALLLFVGLLASLEAAPASNNQSESEQPVRVYTIDREQYEKILELTKGKHIISEARVITLASVRESVSTGWRSLLRRVGLTPSTKSDGTKIDGQPLCIIKTEEQDNEPRGRDADETEEESVINCVVVVKRKKEELPAGAVPLSFAPYWYTDNVSQQAQNPTPQLVQYATAQTQTQVVPQAAAPPAPAALQTATVAVAQPTIQAVLQPQQQQPILPELQPQQQLLPVTQPETQKPLQTQPQLQLAAPQPSAISEAPSDSSVEVIPNYDPKDEFDDKTTQKPSVNKATQSNLSINSNARQYALPYNPFGASAGYPYGGLNSINPYGSYGQPNGGLNNINPYGSYGQPNVQAFGVPISSYPINAYQITPNPFSQQFYGQPSAYPSLPFSYYDKDHASTSHEESSEEDHSEEEHSEEEHSAEEHGEEKLRVLYKVPNKSNVKRYNLHKTNVRRYNRYKTYVNNDYYDDEY